VENEKTTVFARAAISAVQYVSEGECKSPVEAWDKAIEEQTKSTDTQAKGCPKDAFLGLCEEGFVKGVPKGKYTNSKQNKNYALKALHLLKENPGLSSNKNQLWEKVLEVLNEPSSKAHNSQMDVVIALYIEKCLK